MEKYGLNQLRDMFRDFYIGKEHYARQSFSLIPENDKSLLIINSGMAPLKPFFAGLETPPSKRMTTCQKCIRTGDIDNVGYTARHGTFFEMLGSFSFGDYFKEESIVWGWEFMTEVLGMPADRLWPSVYEEDDEAYAIWRDIIGVPEEQIVRLGKDDNFWEIGIGPCGPCSEIYFDRGDAYSCGSPDCKPGCDCDRYVEFWNHVFTQFNRDAEGNYTPLKHKNIDTGMGLERLACIMQEVDSIFDVDTIRHILNGVVDLCGVEYKEGKAATDVSIRIITDHIRSITFMIGDGILPSNEGRGYVLRRLLRRAARHGKLLGIRGAFLANLADRVIEVSGEAYPEIRERQDYIRRILSVEEEKFSHTIDQGTILLEEHIARMKGEGTTVLAGEQVFRLYDTFGFPLELTQEILKEHGCAADVEEYERRMEHQKEMARAGRKADTDAGWAEGSLLFAKGLTSSFVGYTTLESESRISAFIPEEGKAEKADFRIATILLDQTPFYAESGGQASDTGRIVNESAKATVLSVTKYQDLYLHRVKIEEGTFAEGDRVLATVDRLRRNSAARNHTATHLLHQALKDVLGHHVEQAGSSVTAEGLRFDFTHFEAMSAEQLTTVESLVNDKISEFHPVQVRELPIEEAMKTGAAAQFGEKYGAIVRVVSVGSYSNEFCGGTHVENAGQVGAFAIRSEIGVAAGVRRIEAITGPMVTAQLHKSEKILSQGAELLKTQPDNLLGRICALLEENKAARKSLEDTKEQALENSVGGLLSEAKEIKGVRLVTAAYDGYDVQSLRLLSDKIKAGQSGIVVVLASVQDDKVTFITTVTDDLLEKGFHAGSMVKQIAAAAGGGGGGKADMAQAGAKDPAKIPAAFEVAASLLT